LILKGTRDRTKAPAGPGEQPAPVAASRLRPGVADYIAGEQKAFAAKLYPFLPQELVGGAIPHIPGSEDEAVWNAASQACSTERVHYCYSVEEGRIWFLACPSSALASNPDSWCPLAAALPGRSEYWDRETVYLYEQEGMASALRWDPETGRMQVFLGAARTLLPRIQSMDANFVTVNPEVAEVVPWRNRALRTEKLSRASANALFYVGLVINALAIAFLLFQYVLTASTKRDLASVKSASEMASVRLMENAYNALQSDTIRHMVRVQELLDALQKIDGTLVRYEVKAGKAEWEALVPPSFKECTGMLKGCQVVALEKDGRIRVKGNK
jgi:hypothetical protein